MVSVAWPTEAPTRLLRSRSPREADLGARMPGRGGIRLLPPPSEVRALFETTLARSRLPALLGAAPASEASFAAEANGTFHQLAGGTRLTLRGNDARRWLRGSNPSVPIRGRAELVEVDGRWREVFAEIETFADREGFESGAAGQRRAVRVHEDGTRVIRTFERRLSTRRDEEVLRRSTRRVVGGAWEEEEETLVRVGDRARVDNVRRRSPSGSADRPELRCEYPWLIASAYDRAYQRISKWVAP